MNYTQAKTDVARMANQVEQHRAGVADMQAQAQQAENDLNQMQTTYAALSSTLDAEAAANPDDAAVCALKGEKDKIFADAEALQGTWASIVSDLSVYDVG